MKPHNNYVMFKWSNVMHGDLVEILIINDGLESTARLFKSTYRYQGKSFLVDPCKYKWVDKKNAIGVIKIKNLLIELENNENEINLEK